MASHNITFVPCKSTTSPIEVQCSCGVKLQAHCGKDAMNIARVHIVAEKAKAVDEAVTQ